MAIVAGQEAGSTNALISSQVAGLALKQFLFNFLLAMYHTGALWKHSDCLFLLFRFLEQLLLQLMTLLNDVWIFFHCREGYSTAFLHDLNEVRFERHHVVVVLLHIILSGSSTHKVEVKAFFWIRLLYAEATYLRLDKPSGSLNQLLHESISHVD